MATDDERLRRLELELEEQRRQQGKTSGCLYGVLGFVLVAIPGWCPCGLPFGFLTERAGGQERVTVFFTKSQVYQTVGAPGTKQSVQFGVLALMCGGFGLVGGVIGMAVGSSRSSS